MWSIPRPAAARQPCGSALPAFPVPARQCSSLLSSTTSSMADVYRSSMLMRRGGSPMRASCRSPTTPCLGSTTRLMWRTWSTSASGRISTRRISELRLTIEYESAWMLKRALGRGCLKLDIVDYPCEWLLNLTLLRKSYAEWSAEVIAASRQLHRSGPAKAWHVRLAGVDPAGLESEEDARGLAEAFTAYLQNARSQEHELSTFTPGRFLMPGDLAGSPALTFSPLDIAADYSLTRATLAAMMERRYEAYKTHVVKPFFRDHFARLDRQIVLVDMLTALNGGSTALRDLEQALTDVLGAFRPGRASWLRSILTRRIDRILFAATKADHVHHSDHDTLARLLGWLVRRATERAAS